jgi:glycosyltransferase involved in cell wall biosynthesis
LIKREQGWASIYQVYVDLDKRVAGKLSTMDKNVRGVYCYEDGAAETFKAAQKLGLARIYDLPIPYWRTTRVLLEEEAARLPEWEPTLVGTSDSQPKLERKTIELELADVVICNSRFTLNSLPEDIRRQKHCCIAEYGAPPIQTDESDRAATEKHAALRVLFAGSLSQRKGLADLFQAMKLLDSRELELVVMGSPVLPLEFYKQQYDRFIYEPPRSHAEVMKLMRSCDLFVFPSIVEGRGLVQMEAMACGLPLISTVNATADDFIQDGKNGFIVPIRAPEKIAEKLNWFLENRDAIQEMGEHARSTIQQWTWDSYSRKIIEALGTVGV